jgi:hypothetical protein
LYALNTPLGYCAAVYCLGWLSCLQMNSTHTAYATILTRSNREMAVFKAALAAAAAAALAALWRFAARPAMAALGLAQPGGGDPQTNNTKHVQCCTLCPESFMYVCKPLQMHIQVVFCLNWISGVAAANERKNQL